MNIKIKTLDSGITILSDQFKSKTLSFGMWLNVGSVNEKNASEISMINNVDGFLIGTSSLNPEIFYNIYNSLKGD